MPMEWQSGFLKMETLSAKNLSTRLVGESNDGEN
jgi:hypothetical protein